MNQLTNQVLNKRLPRDEEDDLEGEKSKDPDIQVYHVKHDVTGQDTSGQTAAKPSSI